MKGPHKTDFGKIPVSGELKDFYRNLNSQVLHMCRSLPVSVRTEALLFLMQYCGGLPGNVSDFFSNFYVPSWSIPYWINHAAGDSACLPEKRYVQTLRILAMGMLLHSMDDHICDNDLPATHLTLLLRSQSWALFADSLYGYASAIPNGREKADLFIDSYYAVMCGTHQPGSFDEYCSFFKKQMATWSVLPVLMCLELIGNRYYADDVLDICEAFGTAWRLIDDIQDIEEDMERGVKSAVYHIMPGEGKTLWDSACEAGPDRVLEFISCNNIIEKLSAEAVRQIELSQALSEKHGLTELAREMILLAEPLKKRTVSGT